VTGTPADADFLQAQILDALDRAIRPTLRRGASIRYGRIFPTLQSLAAGFITTVNVQVFIVGGPDSATVSWTPAVNITNVALPPVTPTTLFFDDDPEYLQSEGLIFRGTVGADGPARLYYYHDDIGLPRDVDVVITAAALSRVHLVMSGGGPDLDVMSVGHAVSRNFLLFEPQNEGIIVDVAPGAPFILRHALLLQGELVAGAADVHVLMGGPVTVSVIASAAGADPFPYLDGPRVPLDGHNRHGTFDLTDFGAATVTYSTDGADASYVYGNRDRTPRNLNPSDPGRDYGDYGVLHRIAFVVSNPNSDPRTIYLYQRPLGGPVRSSFVVDGSLKELGCARLPQRYLIATYLLPPGGNGASTMLTMTDGGSNYPLEVGVTQTYPLPTTPPLTSPDGCFPKPTPTPIPAPSPFVPTPTPSPEPSPEPT
jgi:hypothetical protein